MTDWRATHTLVHRWAASGDSGSGGGTPPTPRGHTPTPSDTGTGPASSIGQVKMFDTVKFSYLRGDSMVSMVNENGSILLFCFKLYIKLINGVFTSV